MIYAPLVTGSLRFDGLRKSSRGRTISSPVKNKLWLLQHPPTTRTKTTESRSILVQPKIEFTSFSGRDFPVEIELSSPEWARYSETSNPTNRGKDKTPLESHFDSSSRIGSVLNHPFLFDMRPEIKPETTDCARDTESGRTTENGPKRRVDKEGESS